MINSEAEDCKEGNESKQDKEKMHSEKRSDLVIYIHVEKVTHMRQIRALHDERDIWWH
jgi:hypothetical protein